MLFALIYSCGQLLLGYKIAEREKDRGRYREREDDRERERSAITRKRSINKGENVLL